ncbi:Lysosome membrane protein 2 [Fragariocoptes setiger]|uniref:Lysosome membrane protein 2 n=1 Tax=Fragariocoptes setiger TaxID=1670756 RepID=A0ABQ7S787_9ACAR|nr:Lysosome membrane protein 2 [Fragariocoptes setiger]
MFSSHDHEYTNDPRTASATSEHNNGTSFHHFVAPKSRDNNNSVKDIKSQASKLAKTKRWLTIIVFAIGLLIFLASLACILCLPTLVSKLISQKLVLKNGSMLLDRYTKPDVPFYFKVWLFDVTNAQQVIDGKGTKPVLKEIGPFVFRMNKRKDVISFAGDNLYYTEKKVYHFKRELSCCPINTSVTIPNIPLLAVVDKALSYNLPLVGRFIPRLINRAIQSLREQLFVKRTVNEILFDGYDVELLKMVSRVGALVGMPQAQQKFGLLKGRNDTWRPEQDGVWGINTGERDRSQFGRVSSWNSYKRLPFYSAPACNVINGSDGALFPPPISPKQTLSIFNNELCRSLSLMFQRESVVQGISALRFVLDPINYAPTMASSSSAPSSGQLKSPNSPLLSIHTTTPTPAPTPINSLSNNRRASLAYNNNQRRVDNSASATDQLQYQASIASTSISGEQPQNQQQQQQSTAGDTTVKLNPLKCFCERKSTNLSGVNICEFNGLFDMSKCSKQAQVIFGSMPHFHQGDSRLLNQVHGLEPNASKHTTYLDVEPNVGIVLGGKRRFQLNVLMKHNLEVEGFENIADMLVPVIWIEESARITEESANKFRSMYTDRVRTANWVLAIALVSAFVLMVIDIRLIAQQSPLLMKYIRGLTGKQTSSKKHFSVQKVQQELSETPSTKKLSPFPNPNTFDIDAKFVASKLQQQR